MTSVLPNRETILTALTALPGAVGTAGVAASASSASMRAAPSSAEIVPEATWVKISRCRSFTPLTSNRTLSICQVANQNHKFRTPDKLAQSDDQDWSHR